MRRIAMTFLVNLKHRVRVRRRRRNRRFTGLWVKPTTRIWPRSKASQGTSQSSCV